MNGERSNIGGAYVGAKDTTGNPGVLSRLLMERIESTQNRDTGCVARDAERLILDRVLSAGVVGSIVPRKGRAMNTQEYLNKSIVLCRDCRHWNDEEAWTGLGECEAITESSQARSMAGITFAGKYTPIERKPILVTRPGFSCIMGVKK